MVRDWTGRRCGEAALTGLLGCLGPFYPAGPRAPPTLRAEEEAPPPSGPGGGGRPAPGPPSRPMSTPPPPGGGPGWPGASPHRLCRGPTGLGNPWVEKLWGVGGELFSLEETGAAAGGRLVGGSESRGGLCSSARSASA